MYLFVAALTPSLLATSSADASEEVGAPGTMVYPAVPHNYLAVTDITPDVKEQFPLLGSLSNKLSREELIFGGPNIITEENGAADD